MKNTVLIRWLVPLALMLIFVGLGLRLQSAQAQYDFGDPRFYQGGSATVMTQRGGFLYIVQGNTLHKIREKDLAVVGRVALNPLATPYPAPTATFQGMPTPRPTPTIPLVIENGGAQ